MDDLDYQSTLRTQYHHSATSLNPKHPTRQVEPQMSDPKQSKSASEHMKTRAQQLRRDATFPERVPWSVLRDRRLNGVKFRRQHPIGPYVVDFYCISHRLVVELDGNSHVDRGREDRERQDYLESVAGLKVFRVGNDDVLHNRESVVLGVLRALGMEICLNAQGIGSAPSPALRATSPRGERRPKRPRTCGHFATAAMPTAVLAPPPHPPFGRPLPEGRGDQYRPTHGGILPLLRCRWRRWLRPLTRPSGDLSRRGEEIEKCLRHAGISPHRQTPSPSPQRGEGARRAGEGVGNTSSKMDDLDYPSTL